MEYLKINGGNKLGGELTVHGAKNSVLPLLAATVLVEGECILHNCPQLSDVDYTVRILRHLGVKVKREGDTLLCCASSVEKSEIPECLMREMRSSIIFLGALLSRTGSANLSLPGGCDIGLRPIDIHIKALRELGYSVRLDGGSISSSFVKRKNSAVTLPFPSVGATENIILASVFLEGKTRIINAAKEPEISDLCCFLNKCGADIHGAGEDIIEICGVKKLTPAEHTVIPDRILASTFMSAAAATGSELKLNNIRLSHIAPVFDVFLQSGCKLYAGNSSLTLKAPRRLKRVKNIKTMPYPGFPTDSQPTVCAMLTLADGMSNITETVFENRLRYIDELRRFGAQAKAQGSTAVINGVKALKPANAVCTDLRGGAAVAVAALAAHGTSVIKNIYHIDRGYENFERQLRLIGADAVREDDEKEEL